MNRLGFAPASFRAAWLRLDALPQVEAITLMTHLADADAADPRAIEPALAAFEAATSELPGERSVCNSAATLRFGAPRLAPAAAGSARASCCTARSPDHPLHVAADWGLAPAMSLRTRLIAVQELAVGASIGYGSSFTARTADAHRRGGLRLCRRLPASGAGHATSAARRCWWTACAPAPSAGCRWT